MTICFGTWRISPGRNDTWSRTRPRGAVDRREHRFALPEPQPAYEAAQESSAVYVLRRSVAGYVLEATQSTFASESRMCFTLCVTVIAAANPVRTGLRRRSDKMPNTCTALPSGWDRGRTTTRPSPRRFVVNSRVSRCRGRYRDPQRDG